LTAGRWSWKLKTGKECVTTHLPNGVAFKMDVGNNWMVEAIYFNSLDELKVDW